MGVRQEFPNQSAALLALVGWNANPGMKADDEATFQCEFCMRTLAPRKFCEAVDAGRPFEAAEAPSKRAKNGPGSETKAPVRLDPFREHRWYCWWTKAQASP